MNLRRLAPLALVVVVVAGLLALAPGGSRVTQRPVATADGAFASLAEAAAQPVGKGRDTTRPAAGVRGGTYRVDPRDVLPQDGRLVNGCVPGYGDAGACVPRVAPGRATLTCAYLQHVIPGGVAVTGRDSLRLDSNRDGVACGPGDRGVARVPATGGRAGAADGGHAGHAGH